MLVILLRQRMVVLHRRGIAEALVDGRLPGKAPGEFVVDRPRVLVARSRRVLTSGDPIEVSEAHEGVGFPEIVVEVVVHGQGCAMQLDRIVVAMLHAGGVAEAVEDPGFAAALAESAVDREGLPVEGDGVVVAISHGRRIAEAREDRRSRGDIVGAIVELCEKVAQERLALGALLRRRGPVQTVGRMPRAGRRVARLGHEAVDPRAARPQVGRCPSERVHGDVR